MNDKLAIFTNQSYLYQNSLQCKSLQLVGGFAFKVHHTLRAFATRRMNAMHGVIKMKPFAIQPVGKVKRSIYQVYKTFQIGHYLDAFIFKHLVHRLLWLSKSIL